MKLRYFIEYKRPDPNEWKFTPTGVWAHGVDDRSVFEIGYLPGNDEQSDDAEWVINRIVEDEIRELPEDFLEQHRDEVPVYLGSRTKVYETDRYENAAELVRDILEKIKQGKFDNA